MTIKARMARGSKFGVDSVDGSAYKYVGDLTTVGVPTPTSDEIDVSTLDSPNTAKENMPGAVDYGSFDINGNWVKSDVGQDAVYSYFLSQETIKFVIEAPLEAGESVAAKTTGTGYFTSCVRMGEKTEGSLIPFSATLRVTGRPVYVPAVDESDESVE